MSLRSQLFVENILGGLGSAAEAYFSYKDREAQRQQEAADRANQEEERKARIALLGVQTTGAQTANDANAYDLTRRKSDDALKDVITGQAPMAAGPSMSELQSGQPSYVQQQRAILGAQADEALLGPKAKRAEINLRGAQANEANAAAYRDLHPVVKAGKPDVVPEKLSLPDKHLAALALANAKTYNPSAYDVQFKQMEKSLDPTDFRWIVQQSDSLTTAKGKPDARGRLKPLDKNDVAKYLGQPEEPSIWDRLGLTRAAWQKPKPSQKIDLSGLNK